MVFEIKNPALTAKLNAGLKAKMPFINVLAVKAISLTYSIHLMYKKLAS